MCYGKDMTVPREVLIQALRATTHDGQLLEEPDFAVYEDPENGMVVRVPEGASKDFFRQLFIHLGEKPTSSLVARRRAANGTCLYFPGVTLDPEV